MELGLADRLFTCPFKELEIFTIFKCVVCHGEGKGSFDSNNLPMDQASKFT